MAKRKKYLDFYKKCMVRGCMPFATKDNQMGGLCGNFGKDVVKIFTPTESDCTRYVIGSPSYFLSDTFCGHSTSFGVTRQNAVLLLAAMNNEL
jgi:hypothetical protein